MPQSFEPELAQHISAEILKLKSFDDQRIVKGSKVAGMGQPGLSAQPRASGQACSLAPEGLLAIPRS
jgi:hypothetical protein